MHVFSQQAGCTSSARTKTCGIWLLLGESWGTCLRAGHATIAKRNDCRCLKGVGWRPARSKAAKLHAGRMAGRHVAGCCCLRNRNRPMHLHTRVCRVMMTKTMPITTAELTRILTSSRSQRKVQACTRRGRHLHAPPSAPIKRVISAVVCSGLHTCRDGRRQESLWPLTRSPLPPGPSDSASGRCRAASPALGLSGPPAPAAILRSVRQQTTHRQPHE